MHQVLKFSVLLRNTLATTQNTLATQQKEERNRFPFKTWSLLSDLPLYECIEWSTQQSVVFGFEGNLTACVSRDDNGQTQRADPLEPLTARVLPRASSAEPHVQTITLSACVRLLVLNYTG